MRLGSLTGSPSSLKATTPAEANSSISDNSLPLRPLVTQPMGNIRTTASALARSSMKPTMPALSMGGSVLGMAHKLVNPPRAPARLPLRTVSLYSKPGSRR